MNTHGSRRIAAAPISFGVFGDITLNLSAETLLATMADIGHAGTELGPPGFFGSADQLVNRLHSAGLAAVGSYVPLHLTGDRTRFEKDIAQFQQTLTELKMCAADGAEPSRPLPLAILADEGDDNLIAQPFRGPEPALDEARWSCALERLEQACALAQVAGVPVSFHPHFGTFVENAREIDRLLETTDLSLCLDTGHFLLGGADPRLYWQRHAQRVNHIHIKDINHSIFEEARTARLPADHPWWNTLSVRLGEGDVDLPGFLSDLMASDYDGWLAIEQDRAAVTADTFDQAIDDQRHNVRWLRSQLSQAH